MRERKPDMPVDDSAHDELLTYGQVSRRLRLPLGTLYALVHDARIPHVRLGIRLVRFRRSDIERWLADRTVIPASERR
jgi:excisionase family DNA binding protein